jgi:hypothetical protein
MEYHFPGWTVYLNGISLPWVNSIPKWNITSLGGQYTYIEYHFPGWTVYLNGISLPWVDSILKWNITSLGGQYT